MLDSSSGWAILRCVRQNGKRTRRKGTEFLGHPNELGALLADLRTAKGLSLREVEAATGRAVSNAYLSQLETGKIQQPSPNVLNTLADIYKIEYIQLMELAGYLPATKTRESSQRHGRIATFAEHNLTQDEEAQLMDYLQYLRTRKRT